MRFAVYELHRRPVGFGIRDDNAVVQYFVTGENIGVKGVAAEALVAAVKAVADIDGRNVIKDTAVRAPACRPERKIRRYAFRSRSPLRRCDAPNSSSP